VLGKGYWVPPQHPQAFHLNTPSLVNKVRSMTPEKK
jgi:hypothetical protein